MSQHSQSSEEEPSAVEYARANGLSRNYLAEALGISDLQQLQSSLQDALSDSHLHQFNLGPPLKVEERLNLSKDAATLLQSVMRGEVREDIDALVTSTPNAEKRRRPSKLELPLLRTDHATDCRSFGSREGFDIKLQDVKLPLELVDDEKNEGFIYPQRFWDIGPQILHKLKTEKLSATKETVKCIADSIAPAWSEEDAKALWDGELKYKRVGAMESSKIDKLIVYARTLLSSRSPLPYHRHLNLSHSRTSRLLQILLTNFLFFRIPFLRRNKSLRLSRR